MTDLFYETQGGEMLPVPTKRRRMGTHYPKGVNPLISIFGKTEGKKCGGCEHHFFVELARNYPKCGLRKNTHSQKTDHSSTLPACGKFIPKEIKS